MKRLSLLGIGLGLVLLVISGGVVLGQRGQSPGEVRLAGPVGTGFTYQGQLVSGGSAVNGTCDFQFGLFDAASLGTQVGAVVTVNGLLVVDGLVNVNLDFGADAFSGEGRWLEIEVRCPTGAGTFTTLQPRQPLAPVPYAIFAAEAAKARAFDVPIAIQLASASTLFELTNLGIGAAGDFASVDGPGLVAGSNSESALRATSAGSFPTIKTTSSQSNWF